LLWNIRPIGLARAFDPGRVKSPLGPLGGNVTANLSQMATNASQARQGNQAAIKRDQLKAHSQGILNYIFQMGLKAFTGRLRELDENMDLEAYKLPLQFAVNWCRKPQKRVNGSLACADSSWLISVVMGENVIRARNFELTGTLCQA